MVFGGIMIVIIAATEYAGEHGLLLQQDVLSGNFPEAFLHLIAAAFGVRYLDAFWGIDVYEVGELSLSRSGLEVERDSASGLVVHPFATFLLHVAPRGEMPARLILELLGLTLLGIGGTQQDGPVL